MTRAICVSVARKLTAKLSVTTLHTQIALAPLGFSKLELSVFYAHNYIPLIVDRRATILVINPGKEGSSVSILPMQREEGTGYGTARDCCGETP